MDDLNLFAKTTNNIIYDLNLNGHLHNQKFALVPESGDSKFSDSTIAPGLTEYLSTRRYFNL